MVMSLSKYQFVFLSSNADDVSSLKSRLEQNERLALLEPVDSIKRGGAM